MSKDGIVRGKHRSTSLKAGNQCPRRLDYYEQGYPYERDIFQVGIVAHAILEEVGLAVNNGATVDDYQRVARHTANALMRDGRSHVGNPEPPIGAEDVEEGYTLAMRWLERHECHVDDKVEIGMAFSETPPNDGWKLCAFDAPDWRFRGILDRLRIYEEWGEEYGGVICEVLDYKSSWAAGTNELNTVQRWSQCIMAVDWLYHKGIEVDCIRLAIGNLRTRNIHSRDLWLDEEDSLETIARWRRFLSEKMTALDRMSHPRPTNPGPACTYCPYKADCSEGRLFALETTGQDDPTRTARSYAHASSNHKRLTGLLKDYLQQSESIEVDGYEIGWLTTESYKPAPNAGRNALEAWLDGQPLTWDSIAGYLQYVKPNATQLGELLEARYDDEDRREEIWRRLTVPHTNKRFGVRRKIEEDE